MESFPGQPVPFIELAESEEDNKTLFAINPYAISLLQEMRERKIAVLVITGPPSTGKSLLANRILDKDVGFPLGADGKKQTEGIWIWSEPVRLSEEHDFDTLILDMEGVTLSEEHSKNEQERIAKTKLLTLSLLLSSMFIYNSIGTISEKALHEISLVKDLKKYIDTREAEDKPGNADFSSFLPFFLWVLRDFSHPLNGKSPYEYLTESLNPAQSDEQNLNAVRATLAAYFQNRECHGLVKPVADDNQLRDLSQIESKKMKPLFTSGINTLKEKIKAYIKPKTVKGKSLTGSMLMNLAFEFTDALNNDCPAAIFQSVENVIYSETRKMYENTLIEYYGLADDEFDENKMPFEEEQMQNVFKTKIKDLIKKFEETARGFADLNQLLEFRSSALDEIETDFINRLQKNDEVSQHLCKVLINEFFGSFDLGALFADKEVKESALLEYKEKFFSFYENYKLFAKGAHKFDILSDCLPNFLFEFFEKYLESLTKAHQKELSNIKLDTKEHKGKEENLRKKLTEVEDQNIEFQKERDEIKRQYQKHLREVNLQLAAKEGEEQALLADIKSLKEKLYKKKEKSREIKRKLKELEEAGVKDKQEKDILKRQQASMQQEVKTLEAKVRESYSLRNSNNASEMNPQLPEMVKDLFKQMNKMGPSLVVASGARTSDPTYELEKQEEIAIVKQAFEKKLNENWERLKTMKEEYQKDNEKLRKQLEEQRNENAQLRVQLIESTKNQEILHKKDVNIQKLNKELETLGEQLSLKKHDHKVSVEVTEKFKEIVEETNIKVQDQEGKIAELKSEVNRLKASHGDIVYAVKEAVKKSMRRPNTLKNAMEALDEDVGNEIRGMLEELQIKIDF